MRCINIKADGGTRGCRIVVLYWTRFIIHNPIFFVRRHFFDNTVTTTIPIAIYLATKFWMYVTWIAMFWPIMDDLSKVSFTVSDFLHNKF